MVRTLPPSLLVAMLAIAPITASAGGFYYSDSGIEATGRGGAWVAGANTQFAQYYNPAGLIRVDRPTFNVGMSGVQQNVRFARAQGDADEPYAEVRNQAAPFAVPQLGFATPLIPGKLAFAFGFVSPFAPSSDYDPDGAQRYSIIESGVYQFSIGPSIAYQPKSWITLGLGLQYQYLQANQKLKITTTGQENPSGDVLVDVNVSDNFTPNFNAGLLIEPDPHVAIGLAVQPGTRFKARGRMGIDFTGNVLENLLEQPTYQDGRCDPATDTNCTDADGVTLATNIPLVLRFGVAVRPIPDKLEIEAAVVWQQWSTVSDLVVEEVDVTINSPLGETPVDDTFVIGQTFRDVYSLRLGAEYRVIPELSLRIGGFYEPSAITAQNVSVSLVDTNKWQIGGGGTVLLADERFKIDFAAAFLQFQTLDITDSNARQVNAGVFNQDTRVVGNGIIQSTGWIAGAQAQFALGPKRQAPGKAAE